MLEREFQKKRKWQARIYSKTTIVILVILSVFLVRATWGVYVARVESKQDLERATFALEMLEEREMVLGADIERLKTNKGTEEEIRTKFNVAKEGEMVVYVVEDEPITVASEPKKGFWSRVVDFFHF